MVEMVAIELYRMYNIVYDKFDSQSSGNTVTESYRACEMAASCNNVDVVLEYRYIIRGKIIHRILCSTGLENLLRNEDMRKTHRVRRINYLG